MQAEARPHVHITPPSGWLNDPVGGFYHRGEYHLFYQHVPGTTQWRLDCHWGHVSAPDLVRWRHLPVALSPGDGDDGVWSGAAAMDGSGPVLLYTSVVAGQLDTGRVRVARPLDETLIRWRKDADVLRLRAPSGVDVTHFRDPFVWGTPGHWRMLVGAGLGRRGGGVVAYSGPDLRTWTLDGILAADDGAGLGDVWECPQYLEIGGVPILVTSVMQNDVGSRILATAGRWRGASFEPGAWLQVAYGAAAYALSVFKDARGDYAGIAWLRHAGGGTSPDGWAGVLSLPVELTIGPEGVLRFSAHPDVATLRTSRLPVATGDGSAHAVCPADAAVDVEATLSTAGRLRLIGAKASVTFAADGDAVVMQSPTDAWRIPSPRSHDRALRVVADRGVIEAWTGEGRWAALRLPGFVLGRVELSQGGGLAAWRLEPVFDS